MKSFSRLVVIVSLTFIGISCSIEPDKVLNPRNNKLTLKEARTWFEQSSVHKRSARAESKWFNTLRPVWEKAIEGQTDLNESFVEVPLESSKKVKWIYNVASSTEKNNKKEALIQIENNYWLVIYVNKNGQKEEVIKEVRQTEDYIVTHKEKINKGDFSGRVFLLNWSGEIVGGSYYKNGIREGRITSVYSSNSNARETVCVNYRSCTWSSACFNLGDSPDAGYPPAIYGTTTTTFADFQCTPPQYGAGSELACSAWELTSTYTFQQCQDTGPSTPGEGTNPGGGTQTQDPKNPCEHSTLLASNDTFKQKMNDLKSRVNQNYEAGYIIQGSNYQFVQGQPNEPGFNLSIAPGTTLNSIVHSHYTGLLSIFSPDDLYSMAALYKSNQMADPKLFNFGLVTASGTQYLLYIDDVNLFNNFANYISDTGSFNAYSVAYESLFNIRPTNDAATNERNFLSYIKAANIGVRLYKGNASFDQWSPIKMDANNNIVNYPCN